MTERKITKGSFDKGPLRKILNKQEYAAHLTSQGRKRVEEALKAGVERETKKFGLQYGVGTGHADALSKFPTSRKYPGRFDPKQKLKTNELKVVDASLNTFFKRKPPEVATPPKIEKPQLKIVPKIEPKVVPKAPEPTPFKKAA